MEEIQANHRELLDPLDQQERELLLTVNDGFDRLITAHLNIIQEINEVQGDAFKAVRLSGLRDRINKGLVKTSQIAKRGTEQTLDAGQANFHDLEDLKSSKSDS